MRTGLVPFARRALVAVAVLVAASLSCRGGEPPAVAPAWTPQQQAAVDTLDRALARCEALLAQDDDVAHRAATRAMLDDLEKRRAALRAAFDQAKCDDLRTEVILEYHRLAAWMAPPAVPPPAGPEKP